MNQIAALDTMEEFYEAFSFICINFTFNHKVNVNQ